MKRLLLQMLLLFATAAWVQSETLYVRANADCAISGDGTAYDCATSPGTAGAWRGMASVTFNAVDTAGQIDAGDTLKTCGNFNSTDRAFSLRHLLVSVSGAVGSPITITGDCSGDGGNTVSDWDGDADTQRGIDIKFNAHIVIRDIVLHDFTQRGAILYDDSVTDIPLSKYVTLRNMTIHSIRGASAICVDGRGRFITLSAIVIRNCGTDAVHQKGANFLIEDSVIAEVSMDNSNSGDGVQIDSDQDGSIVRRNQIDMTSVDSKYCVIANGNTDSGTVVIDSNKCLRSLTATVGIGILVDTVAGSNAFIRKNTVIGGVYSIQVNEQSGGTAHVYGNLVLSPATNCFRFSGAGSGNIFTRFNTCYAPASNGTQVDSDSPSLVMSHNIFYGGLVCINKRTSDVEYNNILYGCQNTAVANSGTPTTPGTGTLTSDPLLTREFLLQSTSPARRAGIPHADCLDVRGRPCWNPPDIGAYQATSGDPAAPRAVLADPRTPAGPRLPRN